MVIVKAFLITDDNSNIGIVEVGEMAQHNGGMKRREVFRGTVHEAVDEFYSKWLDRVVKNPTTTQFRAGVRVNRMLPRDE